MQSLQLTVDILEVYAHDLEPAVDVAAASLELSDGMPGPVQISIRLFDLLADFVCPGVDDSLKLAHSLDHLITPAVALHQELLELLNPLPEKFQLPPIRWGLGRLVVEAGEVPALAGRAGHGLVQGEVDTSAAGALDFSVHHDVTTVAMGQLGLIDLGRWTQ